MLLLDVSGEREAAAAAVSSYVTGVQNLEFTIPSGSTSAVQAITPIDTTASYIAWNGWNTDGTAVNGSLQHARIEITNGSQITAYRNTGTSQNVTVRVPVISCTSNYVTGIQSGTVTISASTSGTAAITAVDTTLTAVYYLGETTTDTSTANQKHFARVSLTNGSTVTANVDTSSTVTVGFIAVTYAAAAIVSIQQIALTAADAATTMVGTFNAVNTANIIYAYGGQTFNTSGNQAMSRLDSTSTTSATATRGTNASTTRTVNFTVIECAPGVLKSVQFNDATLITTTTASTTVTAVNTAKSCLSYLGINRANASVATPDTLYMMIKLANGSTVQTDKTTGTLTQTIAWELIEAN